MIEWGHVCDLIDGKALWKCKMLQEESFCLLTWKWKSYLTLCDPMGYSPPSFSVHGISQARIWEWAAIYFSRDSSWPRDGILVIIVFCKNYMGSWVEISGIVIFPFKMNETRFFENAFLISTSVWRNELKDVKPKDSGR